MTVTKDKENLKKDLVLQGNLEYAKALQEQVASQGDSFYLSAASAPIYSEAKDFDLPVKKIMTISQKVLDLLNRQERKTFDTAVQKFDGQNETVYAFDGQSGGKVLHVIFYNRLKDQARREKIDLDKLGLKMIYLRNVVRHGSDYHFLVEANQKKDGASSHSMDIQVSQDGKKITTKSLNVSTIDNIVSGDTLQSFKKDEEPWLLANDAGKDGQVVWQLVHLTNGQTLPLPLERDYSMGQAGSTLFSLNGTDQESKLLVWTYRIRNGKVELHQVRERNYSLKKWASVYVDGDRLVTFSKGKQEGKNTKWTYQRFDLLSDRLLTEVKVESPNFTNPAYEDIYLY
ncbi:hypothetical protein D3H64_03360 [Atopobacter sp. AH10]|nr:hypothetical protein D3H64_03360 [Atopobacter sp. AH10]